MWHPLSHPHTHTRRLGLRLTFLIRGSFFLLSRLLFGLPHLGLVLLCEGFPLYSVLLKAVQHGGDLSVEARELLRRIWGGETISHTLGVQQCSSVEEKLGGGWCLELLGWAWVLLKLGEGRWSLMSRGFVRGFCAFYSTLNKSKSVLKILRRKWPNGFLHWECFLLLFFRQGLAV